jgi:hypothetical protein
MKIGRYILYILVFIIFSWVTIYFWINFFEGKNWSTIYTENVDIKSIWDKSFLVCYGIRDREEEDYKASSLINSLTNSGQLVGSKILWTENVITELVWSPFYFSNRLAIRVRTESWIRYIYSDSLEPVLVNFSDWTKSQISFIVSSAQLGWKKYANVFLANTGEEINPTKALIDTDSLLIIPYIQIPWTSYQIEWFASNEASIWLPFWKTNIRNITTVDKKWFYIDTNTLEPIKILEKDSTGIQCRFKLNGEDFYGIYDSWSSMIFDPIWLKKINLKIPNDNDFIVSLTDKTEMTDSFYLVLVELNTWEWWYIDANSGKKIKKWAKPIQQSSAFSEL